MTANAAIDTAIRLAAASDQVKKNLVTVGVLFLVLALLPFAAVSLPSSLILWIVTACTAFIVSCAGGFLTEDNRWSASLVAVPLLFCLGYYGLLGLGQFGHPSFAVGLATILVVAIIIMIARPGSSRARRTYQRLL